MMGRVWVRHAVHGWAEADVVHQLDGGRVRLRMADGANFTACAGDVCPKNAVGMDAPDALENLEHIDDPNVLHALQMRFKAGKPCTWAGNILVWTGATQPEAAGTDFSSGAFVSLTEKLLTRMATREEPQMVMMTGGAAALGGGPLSMGGDGNYAAARALSRSLAAVGQRTAKFSVGGAPPDLVECVTVARHVIDTFLGLEIGSGKHALAACRSTTFAFVEEQSAWTIVDISMSASFVDWGRGVALPGAHCVGTGIGDRSRPKAYFQILAQIIAAAQTGADTKLTATLSAHARGLATVETAKCLEGWQQTLSSMRVSGFCEHEVGTAIQLACVVLNLLGLAHSRTSSEGSMEDDRKAAVASTSSKSDGRVLYSAMVRALGLELNSDTPRDGKVLEAIQGLMKSGTGARAAAASSAAADALLVHICGDDRANALVRSDAPQGAHRPFCEHRSAALAGSSPGPTRLALDLYVRLAEYVRARVNRYLQRSASTDNASGDAREIRVFEAQDLSLWTADVSEVATVRDGSEAVEAAGQVEAGYGLADLMVAAVNDAIVQRMRASGDELRAECVQQGIQCPRSDSADEDERRLQVDQLVQDDGLLQLLLQVLLLPTSTSTGHARSCLSGATPATTLCDSSNARGIVRSLQRLTGYVSARSDCDMSTMHGSRDRPAPPSSCAGLLALPHIAIAHTSGTRTYRVESLLRDAAKTPGGFLQWWEDLALLLRSMKSSSISLSPAGVVRSQSARDSVSAALVPSRLDDLTASSGGGSGVFFIQCLAPNSSGSDHFFDKALVQAQMRATSLVSSARVGRQVLPAVVRMQTFCRRYLGLLRGAGVIPTQHPLHDALKSSDTPDSERVQAILLHTSASVGQVTIGRSKVFLRDDLLASLEQKLLALQAVRSEAVSSTTVAGLSVTGLKDEAAGCEDCGPEGKAEGAQVVERAVCAQSDADQVQVADPESAEGGNLVPAMEVLRQDAVAGVAGTHDGAAAEWAGESSGTAAAAGKGQGRGAGGGAGLTAEDVLKVEALVADVEVQLASLWQVSGQVLRSVDRLQLDKRLATTTIQDLEDERERLQKDALLREQAVEEQTRAAERGEKDRQQAMAELDERDRSLRVVAHRMVERALGEMQSIRQELEDAGRAAEVKEARLVQEAAEQREEIDGERQAIKVREVQAEKSEKEAAVTCQGLRDELEQERAKCRALEDEVKQQQETLAQLQAAAKPCEDDDNRRRIGGDALPSVPEEDQTPAAQGPRRALPTLAAVWAHLNPGALASHDAKASITEGADKGPAAPASDLFPGPSGADIVIRPKGTSSWKVVRPPLENAEDALKREKVLVHRTLEVVAQLYEKQPCVREQTGKENLSPTNAKPGSHEELETRGPSKARDVAGAGRTQADAHTMTALATGAEDAGARRGSGGWNKVRQFLRPDAAAADGSPTPFKRETVLKRLSELRSSLQRPHTPVK